VARPEKIQCEVCGTEVTVAARGKVPRFCAEHTSADLRTDIEREADEQAALARRQIVETAADDNWPQQVAPLVWVGPNGERWTDQAAAELGMVELRRKGRAR
jgi:hypothetical protein